MSSLRDGLRAAGLKSREGKKVIVTFEDQEYEVRAPSVRARSKILAAAGVVSADDDKKKKKDPDAGKMQVACVIACTFAPGTDERVFEDADLETLLDDPAGGIVDALGEHALKFLNASADKEAAKND